MKKAENQLLVIFGASGDLTARKLLPSLFELYIHGLLPEHFCILGASRTPYTDEEFRDYQRPHLTDAAQGKEYTSAQFEDFLSLLHYQSFDPMKAAEYAVLQERITSLRVAHQVPDRIVYYLSTPPMMYEVIPQGLAGAGMNVSSEPDGWRRLVVEKPFGTSLESAQKLSAHLRGLFREEDLYRIDHYLGKETVQNILVLRFSNGIFEPLWNHHYIDSVEISTSETLGVENRGRYYDEAGAMRDMVQNHLMQLMAFMAMEAPPVFEPESIRDEIVKVFRSLRFYTPGTICPQVLRAQYEGYRSEKNVSPQSVTETYVAMKLFIDNWRWSGVPFYLITGKKMKEKKSEIVIHFKSTPHKLFVGQCSGGSCNRLVIRIQPDESVSLKFGLKKPGAGFRVKQVGMDFQYNSLEGVRLPDAYERLLLDVMCGDSTLYTRSDALEASWRFIDPILAHWREKGEKELYFYPPGSEGPAEKLDLGLHEKTCVCKIK